MERIFNDGRRWGRIEAGYTADLVLLDYRNPTPLVNANGATHFVWGMSSNAVHTVLVDGKIILENHEFRNIDADRIYRQAASVAQRVWKTVDKIRS